MKWPKNCSLQVNWYQAVRIAEEAKTLRECAEMLSFTYIVSIMYYLPQLLLMSV
jgi:hypothetical protein